MTDSPLKEPVEQGLKRLNKHEPQYPVDTFFIKNNRALLQNYLDEPSLMSDMI